jgi:hypothetical protein
MFNITHWLNEDVQKHTRYHVLNNMSDLSLYHHYKR